MVPPRASVRSCFARGWAGHCGSAAGTQSARRHRDSRGAAGGGEPQRSCSAPPSPSAAPGTAGTGRQSRFWRTGTSGRAAGLGQPLRFPAAPVRWRQWPLVRKGSGCGWSAAGAGVSCRPRQYTRAVSGARPRGARPGRALLQLPPAGDGASCEVGQNCVTKHRSHGCRPAPLPPQGGSWFVFWEVCWLPAGGELGTEGPEPCFNPPLPVPAGAGAVWGEGSTGAGSREPQRQGAFPAGGEHQSTIPAGVQGILFFPVSWVLGQSREGQTQFSAAQAPVWAQPHGVGASWQELGGVPAWHKDSHYRRVSLSPWLLCGLGRSSHIATVLPGCRQSCGLL